MSNHALKTILNFESENDPDDSSDDEFEDCEDDIDGSFECGSDQENALRQSKNVDKTSKDGIIWTMSSNDSDETSADLFLSHKS